jgi:putative FmdB family regulatory protein
MPTYDYKCPDCDHGFEAFHSMSADPIKDCPECEKSNVRRLIGTGAGLIFKGSGFYITDYRSKAYSESKKAESGSSGGGSEGGSKSESSSKESSPAPKSTPTPSTKS